MLNLRVVTVLALAFITLSAEAAPRRVKPAPVSRSSARTFSAIESDQVGSSAASASSVSARSSRRGIPAGTQVSAELGLATANYSASQGSASYDPEAKAGYLFGVSAQVPLTSILAADAGVRFAYRGIGVNSSLATTLGAPEGSPVTATSNYLEFPLLARAHYAITPKITPFASLGPVAMIRLGWAATSERNGKTYGSGDANEAELSRQLDLAWFVLGMELAVGTEVDIAPGFAAFGKVNFLHALTNETGVSEGSLRTRQVALAGGVSYRL